MTTVQLPIPFLKGLADNPGYTDVWIGWIVRYGEKIKEPFFMTILQKEEKPLPEVLVKLQTVYEYGQPYLQALYFGKAKKETKKSKIINETIQAGAERVLAYLNLKTGVEYGKIKKEPAIRPIIAILKEGYSIYDCKAVIDKKYTEWHGTEMEIHLNPSTLFSTKKFDTYLNQPIKNARAAQSAGSHLEQVHDTVKEAIALNHELSRNKGGEADH